MSNKTQLQTNNTKYASLIETLRGKAVGGGGTPVEQATPTITVNSSTGLITATATQAAGYVAAGTKSATKQLAFQAAQTITPGTTNKTIPANTYLGGVQTIKGDANLVASNIVSGKSIFGVVGTATAGGGGGGGDTSVEDSLITRTVTSYTNDRVRSIGNYAFTFCSNLTTISFPLCTNIGAYAFERCSKLATISFPLCTNIGDYAFYNCTSLTTISFPQCTSIGRSAFCNCSNLTTISFPLCTSIDGSAFARCSKLTTASFPQCKIIGSCAFESCSNLTTISFPQCTNIGGHAFARCQSLTTISFPQCSIVGNSAFTFCKSLTTASFPQCGTISGFAFYGCSGLTKLYLTGSFLCLLKDSIAFSSTGITPTTGSIFVPASLVASYKAATNWTYFSNRIFAYTGGNNPA